MSLFFEPGNYFLSLAAQLAHDNMSRGDKKQFTIVSKAFVEASSSQEGGEGWCINKKVWNTGCG